MTKIKSTKNPGSTTVRPLFGLQRHAQMVRQGWAAERHDAKPGTARQKVSGGQSRGKRGR
jgi:hypothetical protein